MAKKLLRPSERILLALAFFADVLDEYRLLGGIIPAMKKNLYGWTPPYYKYHNFRQTLYRSLRTADIEKVIEGGIPYFRLTSRSTKKLARKFSLIRLQKRKWDGFWTLVVFDIKEIERKKRDFLRKKLKSLGFKMLQRSVYISPHDVAEDLKEFLEKKDLAEWVLVFRQKKVFGGDERAWAIKLWRLEKINRCYEKIMEEIKKAEESEKKEERFKRQARNRFLEVVASDPFLPYELLPKNWVFERAREAVLAL